MAKMNEAFDGYCVYRSARDLERVNNVLDTDSDMLIWFTKETGIDRKSLVDLVMVELKKDYQDDNPHDVAEAVFSTMMKFGNFDMFNRTKA